MLATLLTALLGGSLPQAHVPVAPQTNSVAPTNVLVVVLDDVGCESLSLYGMGAPYVRTPVLESLAARGVTFTNFYSNPLCAPTRALLQTGRYAFRTGFGPNIFPGYQFDLNQAEECISEMVRDGHAPLPATYARAAFGKWHLSTYANRTHPNQCGFEHFAGLMGNIVDEGPAYGTSYDHYFWRHVTDGVETVIGTPTGPRDESTWSGSVTAREAGEWIVAQSRPFFAMVNFIPPHLPYQVPPRGLLSAETCARLDSVGQQQVQHGYVEGDISSANDLIDPQHPLTLREYSRKRRLFYRAMLEATDTNLGQLLARIGDKLDDTVVIVLGDNGTESSAVDLTRYNPRRAKRTCYQLGVRTPCIVTGPLVVQPGRTSAHPVGAVDLWRTVRDLTGARELPGIVSPGIVVDSVSFVPLLTNPDGRSRRRYAFSEVFTPIGNPANAPMSTLQRMITDGHWKLIRNGLTGPEELYRIDIDPLELQNLLPPATTEQQLHYDLLRTELDRLVNSPG